MQVDQAALFYEFSLDRHIPADHLLRSIDRFVCRPATTGCQIIPAGSSKTKSGLPKGQIKGDSKPLMNGRSIRAAGI
jgi:hypothetical protein